MRTASAHSNALQQRTGITRTVQAVRAAQRGPLPGRLLSGPSVVRLGAMHSCSQVVPRHSEPGTDFASYLSGLSRDFSVLQMPLGSKLERLRSGDYKVAIPRIQLLDAWIQPKTIAATKITQNQMELECRDCVLDGSSHVAQLKLNHAFNVLVKVVFTWSDGKAGGQPGITGTASLDVDVDMPFPFSAMPRSMLEGTGDAAFKTTLALMLNGFVSSLVKDYEAWAHSPALRAQRATDLPGGALA